MKAAIEYAMQNIPYKGSEAAIRENILYPILKEIFKKHDDTLILWANKSIAYNKELSDMPDYIIVKQSNAVKLYLENQFWQS